LLGKNEGVSELIETADLEAAEHILSCSYANLRIDGRGQRGQVRITQDTLTPSVRLDRNRFTMSFALTGTPLGLVTIGHLRGGQATYRSAGSERRYGRGNIFFAAQPEDPYAVSSVNADIEVAVVDPGLLTQVAQTEPGRATQAVRFTSYEPVSAQAVHTWKNTLAYIRDAVLDDPETATQPLLAGAAARLLVATALAVFPNNTHADPTIEDRHDAHTATLHRAVTFIDEHAHTDVTIAEIAEATGVTIRAVQLAFRRHLSITPMQYLRQVRLGHAHRDLLAADPAKVKVTDVAHRWGFASTSRFATAYRQSFGVTPASTLRRD
jgi:AraC-like DNA-binding protein